MKRVIATLIGLVGMLAAVTPPAQAVTVVTVDSTADPAIVDLTAGDATTYYSLDEALFVWIDASSTGTGLIDSFVQIGGHDDIKDAYNTTVNNTLDNGKSNQFNHSLLLSAVPIVDLNGTDYYEFLLDINQKGKDSLLSLDEIQILTSETANQSTEAFDSGVIDLSLSTLIYQLDTDGNNRVELDYSLNHGSGSGDMFLYIPTDFFSIAGVDEDFVYLYSKFGVNNNNNDGFEEWAVRTGESCPEEGCPPPPVIPEPTSLLLLGSGLLGALGFGVSRKRI